MAIPELDRLGSGEDIPLERALGAFDMFVLETGPGDFDDVRDTRTNPSNIWHHVY